MNRTLMAAVVVMVLSLTSPASADDVTVKVLTPDKPPIVQPGQPEQPKTGDQPAANPVAGDSTVVLDSESNWRWHSVWSQPAVSVEELRAAGKVATQPAVLEPKFASYRQPNTFETAEIPPLPDGWKGSGLDDVGWLRTSLPISSYQFFFVNLLAVRGKFLVTDPKAVKSLRLTLGYRGGAVVYLNSQEVARLDLPEGEIGPATPGKRYPDEAWVDAAGRALANPKNCKGDDADRIAKRDRRGGPVELPLGALRQGVNVLAIELHRSDLHPAALTWWQAGDVMYADRFGGWGPIALNDVELTTVGVGIIPNVKRPRGIQMWTCRPYDTVTFLDYGDPATAQSVLVPAARNGVFSGRLVVSSDQAIKGLRATVSDLTEAGGGRIAASAVRIRCAAPSTGEKDWLPSARFDGLTDAIPNEITVQELAPAESGINAGFFREVSKGGKLTRWKENSGAMASLWFTVTVSKDAKPGRYGGQITVEAEGLKATIVPFAVDVSAWTVPDPKDFRVTNFAYHSADAVARHYGVALWSEKHFELMGKIMALMAEINSRQAIVNLAVNFYGQSNSGPLSSNEETMVRWIKQLDGSFKHDFAVFDKYLETVARNMGKPALLRVNCWNEVYKKDGQVVPRSFPSGNGNFPVSVLDPVTGKVTPMEQPLPGSEESFAFWKPVLDEVRKRVEARGWWDVTALGHNSYCYAPDLTVVNMARKIWPDGVWSYTAENGQMGRKWPTTGTDDTMPVRYADTIWLEGQLNRKSNYRALLQPRPGFFCYSFRIDMRDWSPLTTLRRVGEEGLLRGHDGISDFGADLFPVKKDGGNRFYCVGNGRGTGGPSCGIQALLYPGPDGPVSTERFEMLRDGVELCEAALSVQRAVDGKKLDGDLEKRAEALLDARRDLMLAEVARRPDWLPPERLEREAQLLSLAGEVEKALGGK